MDFHRLGEALILVGVIIVLVLVLGFGIMGISYGSKKFHNMTTPAAPITVTQVAAGVKCASQTTANATALSCWKE